MQHIATLDQLQQQIQTNPQAALENNDPLHAIITTLEACPPESANQIITSIIASDDKHFPIS